MKKRFERDKKSIQTEFDIAVDMMTDMYKNRHPNATTDEIANARKGFASDGDALMTVIEYKLPDATDEYREKIFDAIMK